MPKDNENKQAADASVAGPKMVTKPHDQDKCVFRVVFPGGVRENGKVYKPGELIELPRGHAEQQNKPNRPVYEFVAAVSNVNRPTPEEPQPLEIS